MIPRKIIIHHSLTEDGKTVSWGAIRKYHMTDPKHKYIDIGYHAGIELVNDQHEILMGRMWDKQGAHTFGQNEGSLGLCFVGNYDEREPSDEMYKKGAEIIRLWMKLYHIDILDIYRHHDFATYKTCPGLQFDIIKLRDLLRD